MPAIRKEICKHEKLLFGSGDYYIFCQGCGRTWCMMGDGPECGIDKDGNQVGADSGKCVPGFSDDKPRVRPT